MQRHFKGFLYGLGGLAVASAAASAAPSVDGTVDAVYGPALAVQAVGTQFGNNTNPAVNINNGSELNAAYGIVDGGFLYVTLTGNLESNFNKLDIFIDSVSGGQNKLRGDNPDVDFNGLNRMGDDGSGNGLRFDAGFESDYFLTTTGGNVGGTDFKFFANFAETLTGGGGVGGFIGESAANGTVLNGSNGIVIGYNLSNVLGVGAFGNPNDSDPATVATGIEMAIPLSLLGNPTGDIRIAAFVNGGGHDFASNQFMGSLPAGTANLGEPRAIDLSQLPGNQYFTVAVPEPTTLGLLAGALALGLRRRK